MGLFDKKKAVQPEPVKQQIETFTEEEYLRVNLTDKMLRVELEADDGFIRTVEIKEAGDRIRLVSGRIIIAEVTKRSKAYKELAPRLGEIADSMTIKTKTGDYGDYFQIKLKFKKNVAVVTIE